MRKLVPTLLLAAAILVSSGHSWAQKFKVIEVYDGDTIRVTYRETAPGPDQIVTEALTQPFHIVSTDKIDSQSVVFVLEK